MRKKLIEVDLPLDDINRESAREKSIRHGHPSTLHLWWARRPLAACRAVIFASLVDDPSVCPEAFPTEEAQRAERVRLHGLLKRLVVWEHSNDAHLLAEARWEIARSVARSRGESPPPQDDRAAVLNYLGAKVPPIYDPFCGGGSIPLEAQRLGLRAATSTRWPC
jgi:putative DNA methylase